jgi:hypothetical protein
MPCKLHLEREISASCHVNETQTQRLLQASYRVETMEIWTYFRKPHSWDDCGIAVDAIIGTGSPLDLFSRTDEVWISPFWSHFYPWINSREQTAVSGGYATSIRSSRARPQLYYIKRSFLLTHR